MQITRKVAPGQRGAQSLLDQSGSKLVCVRSRYDRQQQKRCKTVKLIIEEAPGRSPVRPVQDDGLVALRVELEESSLAPAGENGWRQMESQPASLGNPL